MDSFELKIKQIFIIPVRPALPAVCCVTRRTPLNDLDGQKLLELVLGKIVKVNMPPKLQIRRSLPLQNRLSVRSRIGFNSDVRGGGGIQSRLGKGVITDARQKINLNRTQTGRIGRPLDAREKIVARRTAGKSKSLPNQRFSSSSPIKNLVITTTNSPPAPGLFRSAVSGIGQWGYAPPPVQKINRSSAATPMLTRTIANPLAKSTQFSGTKGPSSMYMNSAASIAKVAPSVSLNSGGRFRSDQRSSRMEDMDVDRPSPAPTRSSMQSRLDSPKFKVKISNLQSSVTLDDIVELFSDVGDLSTAKITSPGSAEAFYKTKSDCLKAVDVYHNRLLDGSPMKVSFQEETFASESLKTTSFSPLKSASGATMTLPKSSSTIKIHPDLSAIHKVLFQPSSSSNAAKMLFKGSNQ